MNWIQAPEGYQITVIHMHGDADIFSTCRIKVDNVEYALSIIEATHSFGEPYASVEKTVEKVFSKVGGDKELVNRIVERIFIMDGRHEEFAASIIGYKVEDTNRDGITKKAVFPYKGKDSFVKVLEQIDKSYIVQFDN